LAVQGSERKFNICDRCFASVPLAQAFCLECGAPMLTEERQAETSDAAVYTELARANLLRMRGEYKQAEEQCLNILKRFPNNASANTLLGDISAEQNDLAQAVEWYELSLDIVPDDDAVKRKLDQVKERIAVNETAATAQQLGLPANNTSRNRFIAVTAVLIVVLAVAAYFFGTKEGEKHAQEVVNPAVVIPGNKKTPVNPPDPGTPDTTDSTKPIEVPTESAGELPLLRKLQGVAADGSRVLAVMRDPRNSNLTIVYQAREDNYTAVGARLARDAFQVEPDALVAYIRAMRGGTLVYTADVLRSRWLDTTTNSWQKQNSDNPEAWVDYVLTNPWGETPPKSDQPTATPESDTKTEAPKEEQVTKQEPTPTQTTQVQGPESGKQPGDSPKGGN